MSTFSFAGRLFAGLSFRQPSRAALAWRTWRFYSPKGSQLPVVEEKRQKAVLGGGERRMEKQHKSVSNTESSVESFPKSLLPLSPRDVSLQGNVLVFFLTLVHSESTTPLWSTPALTLEWTARKTRSQYIISCGLLVMIFIDSPRFRVTAW